MTDAPATAVLAIVLAIILLRFALLWLVRRSARSARGLLAEQGYGRRAWARTKPLRAWSRARAPGLYGWLAARFDPHLFSGLTLTLIVAACLYAAFLFGGLLEDVVEQESIVRIDEDINSGLTPWRSPWLLAVFLWITDLGGNTTFVAVAIVATGFLWADARPAFILPLWVTLIGSQATTHIGKYLVARPRPEFLDVASAYTASFPSGHSTAAMAVYGFLAYAMARDVTAGRARFDLAYWTAVLVLLVGFSRMFLSVHYLSDVLAGFLVGGFWLLVGIALTEWLRGRVRVHA